MDGSLDNNASKIDAYRSSAECYEANQIQQEEIEKNIKESGPLITEILPLSTLSVDFAGHEVYLEKLQLLKERYSGIRRIRRDGNCFYRAFGFAYMEHLLNGNRKEEARRLIRSCDKCKETLIANGYTSFTVEDFHEQFTGMVEQFVINQGDISELFAIFNDQAYSDYYIVFLRLLVSAYMQRNSDFYGNFLSESKSVKIFCETEVEPMGLESDNVHVAAMALSVGVPICIENCQLSGQLNRIEFPARLMGSDSSLDTVNNQSLEEIPHDTVIEMSPNLCNPVTLLYRPGHYDILYSV